MKLAWIVALLVSVFLGNQAGSELPRERIAEIVQSYLGVEDLEVLTNEELSAIGSCQDYASAKFSVNFEERAKDGFYVSVAEKDGKILTHFLSKVIRHLGSSPTQLDFYCVVDPTTLKVERLLAGR